MYCSIQLTPSCLSGAFSNVYAARDMTTGRKVAIKVAQKPKPEKVRCLSCSPTRH